MSGTTSCGSQRHSANGAPSTNCKLEIFMRAPIKSSTNQSISDVPAHISTRKQGIWPLAMAAMAQAALPVALAFTALAASSSPIYFAGPNNNVYASCVAAVNGVSYLANDVANQEQCTQRAMQCKGVPGHFYYPKTKIEGYWGMLCGN